MKKISFLTIITLISLFSYAQSWNLVGNANTTATSFLGTTNSNELVFKTNSIERLRVSLTGRVLTNGANFNMFFGVNTGNETSTGTFNVGVGINTFTANTTGYNNTAIGGSSLRFNTTGRDNTALGAAGLNSNTTGMRNTTVGSVSLYNNIGGNDNSVLGCLAMNKNTTGIGNCSFGLSALFSNTTGNGNVALGNSAAYANLTGSNNTIVGNFANVGASNLNNASAIGNLAYVTQDNSMVLGSINGINGATANTNIGIGTTAPTAQLHTTGSIKFAGLALNATPLRVVVSDVNGNIGYKDASTFGSTADGSETKVNAGSNVTVSGSGTLASPYIVSANVPTIPLAQWVASTIGTDNIVNANAGAVVIGSTVATLPIGYKLYVADGILAEKVKVALKSGTNWADYVFSKNYKLAPLSEVEIFINKNKHLPGIQSATELVKEGGVDVNEMFAKQMEKIEELTLYIIQQNKKIELLEKTVKKMSK